VMKAKAIAILIVLGLLNPPLWAQVEGMDSIISVEIHPDDTVKVVFAKWMIMAEKAIQSIYDPVTFPYRQRIEDDGSAAFFAETDSELTKIKEILDGNQINYEKEIDVSLTTEERQWVSDSGITDRADVQAAIERNRLLSQARTVEDLKQIIKEKLFARRRNLR